jgi:formylglycine-generating enzyme required for sulfatase activity
MRRAVVISIVLAAVISPALFQECSGPSVASSTIGNPEVEAGLYGMLINGNSRQPAEGALVKAYSVYPTSLPKILAQRAAKDSAVDSAIADENGWYVLDGIPNGTYSLRSMLVDGGETLSAIVPLVSFMKKTFVGVDTLHRPGAISGQILVHGENDRRGITCYIPGTSFIAISDSLGNFKITHVPGGMYSVSCLSPRYNDTIIGGIIVVPDSVTKIPAITLRFDLGKNGRSISGELAGNCERIKNVSAYISGDGIPADTPLTFVLDFNRSIKGYTGFVSVPNAGNLWKARICVFDSSDHRVGISDVHFNKNTGDIILPAFAPYNALPYIIIGKDTTVNVSDSIRLRASASDTFGGRIERLEWDIGATGRFVQGAGDTVLVAPNKPCGIFAVFRATDDDSNKVTKQMTITVVQDTPKAIAGAINRCVDVGKEIRLTAKAVHPRSEIIRWEWRIGPSGVFVEASGDTVVPAPMAPQLYNCYLRITNNQGMATVDSVTISVTRHESNMVLVLAKSRSFRMGNDFVPTEAPAHMVGFSYDFWMDTVDVTQDDYSALMAENPSVYQEDSYFLSQNHLKNPVENVTWQQAALYCNARSVRDGFDSVYVYGTDPAFPDQLQWVSLLEKNGYRLPSEAEWEYACRAGTSTRYFWGDTINGDYLWYWKNSVVINSSGVVTAIPHNVGKKLPNGFGLYDMIGNVFQWCNDWYGSYDANVQTDPVGPGIGSYRVIRGCFFGFEIFVVADDYRCTYRRQDVPPYPTPTGGVKSRLLGFRCVRRNN